MRHVFVDVETGGLDPKSRCLLEVCFISTDENFNILRECRRTINFEQGIKTIDEYCHKMHTTNHLLEECLYSPTIDKVDEDFRDFFKDDLDYENNKDGIILGGSSVHFDKGFLIENFPWLAKKLHYRLLDVRALLLTYKLDINLPCPKDTHRAGPDCVNALFTVQEYRLALSTSTSF